jgi:hypothetical protein
VQLGREVRRIELIEHLRGPRHQLPGVQVDDVQLLLGAEGELGVAGQQRIKGRKGFRHRDHLYVGEQQAFPSDVADV